MNPLLNDLLARPGEIDLWEIDLPQFYSQEKELFEILDEREKLRATKFVFPHLTSRYTIGHALLRIVLARYSGQDPRTLHFNSRVRGKPFLAENPHQIEFNYSDSHDKGLIGISIGDEIGVDIEKSDPKILTKGLETSIFGEKELLHFYSHSHPSEAFYCGWTQKEAMLKLLGTGLYLDPKVVEVPLIITPESSPVFYDNQIFYVKCFLNPQEYYVSIASSKAHFKINPCHY